MGGGLFPGAFSEGGGASGVGGLSVQPATHTMKTDQTGEDSMKKAPYDRPGQEVE